MAGEGDEVIESVGIVVKDNIEYMALYGCLDSFTDLSLSVRGLRQCGAWF